MERRGFVVLLVVLIPSLAHAQRVEIGAHLGQYQQTPRTHHEACTPSPPCSIEIERDGGGTLGGHVSLVGARFGITASVQHARTLTSGTFVDATGVTHQIPGSELRSTFFALQPHARLPISKVLEANVAGGPSWTDTDALGLQGFEEVYQSADEWLGLALSVALRARLGPNAVVDLRGSNMYRLGSGRDPNSLSETPNRNHWIASVGMAWALKR